tara:strand:- start:38 stop:259 length:222 start_codon:yes stop_codon:yes gene_type:complete
MTKCQNLNCYNGKNCPISQETHDLVKNQKRKAELKRLENCFRIIRHELLKKNPFDSKIYHNLSMLKELREYMI